MHMPQPICSFINVKEKVEGLRVWCTQCRNKKRECVSGDTILGGDTIVGKLSKVFTSILFI